MRSSLPVIIARKSFTRCPNLYLLLAMLALLNASPSASGQSENTGPRFSFLSLTHDFGSVPTDTIIRYRFEFANSGTALLVITDAALSCPCFEVDWSRGPLMPGEKGWVDVAYPTTAKPGPFDKLIWLSSNAMNNPPGLDKYELRIKGIVVKSGDPQLKSGAHRPVRAHAALKIEQSILDMGEVSKGAVATRQLVIRNTGNSALYIHRIIGSDSGVLATYAGGPVLPGKKAEIRIDVRRNEPGPFSRTFNVLTNAINSTEQWPGRTFIVKGRVGAVKISPKKGDRPTRKKERTE